MFAGDAALTLGVMPGANAQLSVLTRRIAFSAANAAVEQRVFAEDFPGQLLYVDKIDRGTGRWHGILLFDTTNPAQESLVTADSGDLVIDPHDGSAWLNLQDTTTHLLRPDQPNSYRKNDNNELRIRLRQVQAVPGQRTQLGVRETLTGELLRRVAGRRTAATPRKPARPESNSTNGSRSPRPPSSSPLSGSRSESGTGVAARGSGSRHRCSLVVAYYVLLNDGELLATGGKVPVAVGMWLPNLVLLLVAAAPSAGPPAERPAAEAARPLSGLVAAAARLAGAPFRLLSAAFRRLWFGKNGAADRAAGAAPARVPGTLGIIDRYLLRQCLSFFA